MSLSQDLSYGLRQLRNQPGFTAVGLATLALGIGATTAIFSLVNAMLLRPLPFADPPRLVALHEGVRRLGYPKMGFSPPDLAIFARAQTSFSAIGWFKNEHVNVSGHDQPERVIAARVSSSLFPMLGARPALGRTFTEEEDAPGHNVVLLSYAGVEAAGLSNDLPLGGREMVSINVEGTANAATGTPQAICQSWILRDYFPSLGIPLLQGRWFTPQDRIDSEPVAIVSLGTARKFWPGQNAIGRHIRWGVYAPWQTVVGVVADVNQGPIQTPISPHVYRPYNQLSGPFLEEDPFGDWHTMNFAVRTQVEPASLTAAVINAVHSLDPDLAVTNVRVMTEVVHRSFAAPKFNTVLVGALAGLALLLAGIGIYGVLAYVVAQQTGEIGLRMALGARPWEVLRSILSRGARLALTGSGLGLAATLGLTRLFESLLYGISAIDPITFLSVVALLAVVGLVASFVPAYRAAKIEPMVALRYE